MNTFDFILLCLAACAGLNVLFNWCLAMGAAIAWLVRTVVKGPPR